MSRLPSNRGSQSFIEYALILILLAIVMLSILLIVGDDIRTFINDLGIRWLPTGEQPTSWLRVTTWWGV
jgi:hypothetical protein